MNRLVLFIYGVAAAFLMCAGTALGDVKELCVGVWKGGASGLSKETGVESLSDSFHVDTRGSGFVRAFFQTGYSERGPQPADADVLVSEWRNSRPRGIVDPKRTFRNGIDKIKDSAQAYKGAGIACGEGWQVRSRGMWHSWTENAMMDWNTAKADNEVFIKLLEPRFEGRFPCKGTVLTIRTN